MAVKNDVGYDNPAADPCCMAGKVVCGIPASLFGMDFLSAGQCAIGVYIDITGNKEIYKRPEMVHLLKDCKKGAVNLIFSQTRAYLAANTCDFCFLLKYLFDLPMRVDIVTDDDDQRIDTILDVENQRQNLKELAEKYTSIRRKDYLEWKIRLEDEMTKAEEK